MPNESEKPESAAEAAPPEEKLYGNWMVVALVCGAIAFGVVRFGVAFMKGFEEGRARAQQGR